MTRKTLIIGLIIIFAVGGILQGFFGAIYDTPEAALMNRGFNDEFTCKEIIDAAWMGEEPVIFYISKYGDLGGAEFKKKQVFGKNGWKVVTAGLLQKIKNYDPSAIVPGYMRASKHTNNDKPNQVLYGVTKSAKADTIRGKRQNAGVQGV